MVNYYLITLVISLVCLMVMMFTYQMNHVSFYILAIMLVGTVANAGYLLMAVSRDLGEAILAKKISYLGGCFTTVIFMYLIFAICNYSLSRKLKVVIMLPSIIVYGMVMTIGYSDFYYKDEYLYEYGGAKVLGAEYGPGHTFLYVLLIGFILIQIALIGYSFARKKVVSRSNLMLLLLVASLNVASFLVGRFINPAIEVMASVYAIDSLCFLYMNRRWKIYNIRDNIRKGCERHEAYGYAFVDCKMRYLGCNDKMLGIFPWFASCEVDEQLSDNKDAAEVFQLFEQCRKTGYVECGYELSDMHYECHVEPLMDRNKRIGYMIEMEEDTDKWRYTSLLAAHNSNLENFQKELEKKVEEQTGEITRQKKQIDELYMNTVIALSDAVDAKDRYTSGHSKRVAAYARLIAIKLGKTPEEQNNIYRAGLLHDVGKIRVPEEIINKPGKLTDDEYNIIKVHSVTGYHILKGVSEEIAIAAKYHHERYDGKGYPNGLAGEEIPEIARILAVADSYDAMASNRSYRNALPQEVVRSEIVKGRGTQFDPVIADIMLEVMDEDKEYRLKQNDSRKKKILCVDEDTPDNEAIVKIMADEPMYEVITTENVEEVSDILSNNHIDLLLVDARLWKSDNRYIKDIKKDYTIPTVLTTNNAALEIFNDSDGYDCDDYITKPFLPLLVRETVYNLTREIK